MSQATSLTAQNTFAPSYRGYIEYDGNPINIVSSGTWVGTIVVQVAFGYDLETWIDVPSYSYTGNFSASMIDLPSGCRIRCGFKTGGYTSGTAVINMQ